MTYDREAHKQLNEAHLLHPQPGDYWHEMYCPVARVLDATDSWVILQKVGGLGGKEISDSDPKPCAMKLSAFKRWLSYRGIEGTWANVMPRRFPPRAMSPAQQKDASQ